MDATARTPYVRSRHEMDTTEIHPYFTAKAEAVFRRAGGDPTRAGALAAWASAAHASADSSSRDRVAVADDGAILAEARWAPGRVGAAYVRSVADDRDRDLIGRELGLAVGALSGRHSRAVIVVTYSEVCAGAAPR